MTTNLPAMQSVSDIQTMANAIAKSGLFGMKKPEEAMALMLIAQAEGQHPALAARDYHIIQGKPALKADAMLARFQAAGGKVNWKHLGDEAVSAEFSHAAGGTALIEWTMAMATRAGFAGKDNWKKFPRAMLRARVISEGIRTVFPGVVIGVYTPEEVQDFDDKPQPPAGRGPIIEGQTKTEAVGDTFTPDWPTDHPISKLEAQELFDEATNVLEVVDNAANLESWRKQYAAKVKNCSQYQFDNINKAFEAKKSSILNREMDQQSTILMAG